MQNADNKIIILVFSTNGDGLFSCVIAIAMRSVTLKQECVKQPQGIERETSIASDACELTTMLLNILDSER